MASKYIASVDIGGTKILGAILNTEEGIVYRYKRPSVANAGDQAFIMDLADFINQLMEDSGVGEDNIAGITLGVPGSVDIENGIIGMAPNLGLVNFPIADELKRRTHHEVFIENDVNIAALGIHNFGVAQGRKNVLVVFVGTGIGGGMIIDGKLYRGASSMAGEIGHMHIRTNGPLCGCGKHGCFEAVASRTAIVRDITTLIKKGKSSVLKEKLDQGKPIKSKAISSAIEGGDKVAKKVMSHACEVIGTTVASINNLMNFEMVVFGGGVLEANENYMLPKIKKSFFQHSLPDAAKVVDVVGTRLRDDAPLYGGIPLIKEYLGIDL